MPIIGRARELKQLDKVFASKKAEFVALYGRRRIGKTFLVREYFSKRDCYFFHIAGMKKGTHRLSKQWDEFRKELQNIFYTDLPATRFSAPKNWHDAFNLLNDAVTWVEKLRRKPKKIVLFFDELPWMATPKSGLLEAIDYFWNRYWVSHPNIILVVCGSSSSWIIEKILNNRGGLHNRVTLRLPLGVFNLNEVEDFFASKRMTLNHSQIAQLYMVLGGVPFYLDAVESGQSAAQAIDALCFTEKGLLRHEFDNLYEALFFNADAYVELIRLIAKKPYGISRVEIEDQAKRSMKGGTLSKRLKELEQSGFISRILAPHKQRQTIYQCIDEYTLFYLKWIEPTRQVHAGRAYWYSIQQTPDYYAWAGIAFEILCYKHIPQIEKALQIPAGSLAYAWRSNHSEKNVQIDLVFDRNDGAITLCEIKYTHKPFVITKEYYQQLLNKVQIYSAESKTSKQIFLSMVSANGLKSNNYSGIITNVATFEDLFSNPE